MKEVHSDGETRVPGRKFAVVSLGAAQLVVAGAFSETVIAVPYVEQTSYYILLALGLVNAIIGRRSISVLRWNRPFLLFLLICLCSITWSVSVLESIRLILALTAVLCICSFAITALPVRSVALALAVSGAVAVAVAGLMWAAGVYGVIDPAFGTLRGTFVQKNVFARELAVGAAGSIVAIIMSRSPRDTLPPIMCLLVIGGGLFSAGSNTALLSTAISAAILIWVVIERRIEVSVVVGIRFTAVGLLAFIFSVVSFSSFLALASDGIGRDATLTGRTSIWAAVLDALSDSPVFGYGYGAFWSDSALADVVSKAVDFDVPHAHNGVLDLALGVGFVGVGALILALRAPVWGLLKVRIRDSHELSLQTFAAGMVPLVILVNITESQLLSQLGSLMVPIILLIFLYSHEKGSRETDGKSWRVR